MARVSSTKSWLWHQHLSHLNFETINDLARNDLVSSLPKFKYHKEHLCPFCEQGKSKRASHPPKPVLNLRQSLHLLHMDLCGPMRIASINGKRYYNQRIKIIMETMNVSFDELSTMAFEQCSSKPGLQSMTSGQISSGLDLTYAPSTITTQQPTKGELDLLFEAMYDDYIGGQPSATARTVPPAQEPQDVDELNSNAMVDGNTFVSPFVNSSTSAAESSSSQNNVKEAMIDPAWIDSMQEELIQFKRLDVYVDDIIFGSTHPRNPEKYGMESYDPVGTPMEIKDKLDLDHNGTPVDATKYRSMIGVLMYLTSSRPNIVHATFLCARYQAKPTEKHLKEVKRIFRYPRGTINTSLWYTKDYGFELTGFSDADYVGCKDTFKSTSGGAQFLSEKLLMDYGFQFSKIPIYCDSKSAIAISCNPVQHSKTKHIAVRYHFIKEHVEKGMIELYFVKTDYQLADLFTKALPADRFKYLVRRLGMRSLSPQELERLAKSQ
nr:hypothetical protein [Tanacetum cinerariifolium]